MNNTPPPPIAKRAILIGVLLIIVNSYWLAYIEMIWHTAHLTTVALSVNVLFAILMTTWLNIGGARRCSERRVESTRFAPNLRHAWPWAARSPGTTQCPV